jgi:hypothetical protein
MHDAIIDIVSALLALASVATFAAMAWAARQVDGRMHAPLRPHLPHMPHLRRRA